jgi:Fic family protein
VDEALFRDSPVGGVVPIRGPDPRFNEEYDHWAFVPAPLPVDVNLSGATWRVVGEAMLALGQLDQAGRQVTDSFILRRPTLRREAQSTSALEGTVAPLEDLLELDPDDSGGSQSPELTEVLNYVRAAEYAYAWVAEDRPISPSLLFDLHRLLVRGTKSDGTDAGQIRGHQVVIGPPGTRVQDSRFVPPPPGLDLNASFRDWAAWVERPRPRGDVLVAAALGHYQFETLHPFNDGNGRLGRLVIVLQLLRSGALSEPLLTVSPWFEARRREYQDNLQRVSETGDWDRWVCFFVEGIRAQAESTTAKVTALLAYRDRIRTSARSNGLKGVAIDIIEDMIAWPVVTISAIAARHQPITSQAVGNAVKKLVEMGVLVETTGRSYGRVFAAPRVMEIIAS